MQRLLLTGANGFVGAHAIRALQARGFEIHALGLRPPAAEVAFHSVNLLDPEATSRAVGAIQASHLLHLAWYAVPGLYWRSPANLEWVAGSLALVRAFREAGGERAVAVGTCAEYAWGPERLREDGQCRPATLYGAAKDGTRRILAAYADEVGLSLAWGRLFFLYGPGEKPGRLVSDAIRALTNGERFPTTMGHQLRDFIYIKDAAEALTALLVSGMTGPVNIASGEAVPVRTILMRLGKLTGRPDLIEFGTRLNSSNEPDRVEADVTQLTDVVGFKLRYDLDDGLKETLTGKF